MADYDSDSTGNCTWPATSYYGSIFPGSYPRDLVRLTDNAGNQSCYQYDTVHRLTGKIHPYGPYYCARGTGSPSTSPDQYFVYDSATVNGTGMINAKGRLAEAYTCARAPYSPGSWWRELTFSVCAGSPFETCFF
jgi:YD repeat-containing protein